MYSVTIIIYGDISDIKINNVYHLNDAISYIKNKMSQNIHDDNYVDKIHQLFLNLKKSMRYQKKNIIKMLILFIKKMKTSNN